MITLSLKYGSSALTGITFSVADQVDIIKGYVSCRDASTKLAYLSAKINGQNQIVFGTFTEPNSEDHDLELVLQTNDPTEIVYDEGQYMGLKNVLVEAII